MYNTFPIDSIRGGRCFMFVGSGPSCEMGYPSWRSLVTKAYDVVRSHEIEIDAQSFQQYLDDRKLPECLQLLETAVGNRLKFIEFLKPLLVPQASNLGAIYDIITGWPIACYLTTNFDNEIKHFLDRSPSIGNDAFVVRQNSLEDMSVIRHDTSHLIVKLHSDLDHPEDVVLTSFDYQKFYAGYERGYFRDKLRQIFEMFDMVVIGYSLSDPDIQYVLQQAKTTASPQHPIYMIVADCSPATEEEYYRKYNIRLIRYSNRDGNHAELRRLLKTVDRFIPHKRPTSYPIVSASEEEIETAIALFVHRRLQGTDSIDYLSPVLLSALEKRTKNGLLIREICDLPVLKIFSQNRIGFSSAVENTLTIMLNRGVIQRNPKNSRYSVTKNGKNVVLECRSTRILEKEQAFLRFCGDLKEYFPTIDNDELKICEELAHETLIQVFRSRGLTIANQIFSDLSPQPGELSDIFKYISDRAATLKNSSLQSAFMMAMHQFLVEPNASQKRFLASISQGYFMYHFLGHDPRYIQVQQKIFQRTIWFFDSSVLLPFIAKGCENHGYIANLFSNLSRHRALLFTTENLLLEAWGHLKWAMEFVKGNKTDSIGFLRAVLVKGSYTQNLFLDGFIRLSESEGFESFSDYLDHLFCNKEINQNSFNEIIESLGIKAIRLSALTGFSQTDWNEMESVKEKIRADRESRGTYRSEHQIEAEAEIWTIISKMRNSGCSIDGLQSFEKVYFISQSPIINRVSPSVEMTTWTAEALYRYVSTLPGAQLDPNLFQQCLLLEYYYAGISHIDKELYSKFFSRTITASKETYENEIKRYKTDVEDIYKRDIDNAFSKTPDLEKPFFIEQMGWRLANSHEEKEMLAKKRSQEATQLLREAQAKIKRLEAEKSKAWKNRETAKSQQEIARLRNLHDPKHVKKLKRQAKKRKKNK